MSEPLFTANQIARALGCSPTRARQLMAGAAAVRKVELRGQQAQAWPAADFPRRIRERLEALADAHGCRGVHHLLLSDCTPWTPALPKSEIDELQYDAAIAKRDVLAPILCNGGYTAKVSALTQKAMAQLGAGNGYHPRTIRRWIEIAKERDGMRCEWERPELYLDEKLERKNPSPNTIEASFLDADGIIDINALWLACCHELRKRIGRKE